jgi:FtsH-binding integral membrane protein
MPAPLTAMYLLSVAIGVMAFLVSRGPDGNLLLFLASFAVIGVVYVTLAWVTRHQPIWLHLGAHSLLFVGAAALGMAPKPHLNEMGGMLYLLLPAAIVVMVALACVVRLLARWI